MTLSGIIRCPSARKALVSLVFFVSSSVAYTRLLRNISTKKGKQKEEDSMPHFQIVFVLGGPGSGKGTQCETITTNFPTWTHLSAGDLLRAERQKSDSKLAEIINARILNGQIVPSEITVQLLKNAMEENYKEKRCTKFVIDGFPRSEENRTAWEDILGSSSTVEFVLYLDCPEEVMTERLLRRGQTSGRVDDNLEIMKKRFETSRKESMPMVELYESYGKLRTVKADRNVEEVYQEVSALFKDL